LKAQANALAESFVDSFKTELIADRVWRSRAQLEIATVEYIGWFNHDRLHEALGDIPPVEFEQLHHARQAAISGNGSVAAISPRTADGLTTRPISRVGVDFASDRSLATKTAPAALFVSDVDRARTAPGPVEGRNASAGLCALRYRADRSNRK
jgi:putative transposase